MRVFLVSNSNFHSNRNHNMSVCLSQSEENAMARLIEERMEAERKERELERSRRELQEIEEQRRAALELEQSNIERELRLKEEEEERQREAERQRILEVGKLYYNLVPSL